jgi:hypothetical protein
LFEGDWPKHHVSVKGKSCKSYVNARESLPSNMLWCDDTSSSPPSRGAWSLRARTHKVDVPHMERYMKALKWYVRNVAWLEGSMATRYVIEEALGFCTEYIQDVKFTRRVWDDKEEPTMHDEILEGNGCSCRLNANLKSWAHTFVLHNAATTQPWCEWDEYFTHLYIEPNTMGVVDIIKNWISPYSIDP